MRFKWSLHEKYPNPEFFWSLFSHIRTEYGKIRTRKKSVFGHFSHRGLVNTLSLTWTFSTRFFEKKVFLMLYFSNWSDFSVWLSLLFEILGNMYIVITYFSVYKVINFEVHFQILHDHKFQDNNLNILIKKALKVK